jgi:hypothetical protein
MYRKQFDQINWPHFRAVSSKFSLPKRFFFIKWLNDILPFQARMHQYGQSSMAGCPHECGCDSEDHHHLLHCSAPACQDLFLLDPLLRKAFLTLLSPYWGEQAEFDLLPAYSDLILFQQDLHPDSVFMACLSTDWTTLQHVYLALNKFPRHKRQAETTIMTILTYLLNMVHSVWLTCNSALHGDDATTQLCSYKHTRLLLEIQNLYDQQD